MRQQQGFIPAAWIPYLCYTLIALAVASAGGYVVYVFNDRANAKRELKLCQDLRQADIDAAVKESVLRQAKEDEKSENWRKYALSEQQKYEAKLDVASKRKPVGVYSDPGANKSSGRADQASPGSPEVPAKPAPGSELSGAATAFLQSEALRADQAAIYADEARNVALACIAELSAK